MFKSFPKLIFSFAFWFVAFAAQAQTQSPNLTRLGSISVTPGSASDRVDLRQVQGRSSAIVLVAASGPIAIDRITVTYSNGQTFIDDTKRSLNLKDRTKRIDERIGEERFVDAVEVHYQEGAKPVRAGQIEVWARQSASGAAAVRAAPANPVSGDGRLLGEKDLSLLVDSDTVTLEVPVNPGGQIRLKAMDRTLYVQSVTVVAATGESETIDINAELSSGVFSPWFAVRTTDLKEVRISYRPQANEGGVARIAFFGMEAAPPPTTRAIADDAEDRGYVEVPVFFGTDRQRETDLDKHGRKLAVFTGQGIAADRTAALGMSVVTVPTSKDRQAGTITRPEWNLYLFTFALRDEDMKRDFTIQSVDVLPEDDFVAKAKARMAGSQGYKDAALVFVHGYNVTFNDALFRTAQIAHDTRFDGAAFLYSWPSKGRLLEYTTDYKRVLGSRDYLAGFLELIQKKTGARRIHLIAHSMGAHLLTEVLRDEKRFLKPDGGAPFDEIIFAAPDVTNDNFTRSAKALKALAKGVTLYASSNDVALNASGRLAGTAAGYVPKTGKPLVVAGVESIDVSAASTSFFALNHSDFADRIPLLTDMEALLLRGTHPPSLRSATGFSEVGKSPGLFWRLVKP